MLVLTRKQAETIQIGDSITITVLRMKGKAVRLGIQAPRDMNVIRGELAFEQAGDQESAAIADEPEEVASLSKPKSRVRDFRQDSWSTKATQPAGTTATPVAVAWSI